jgi:hypothetical protein
MRDSVGSMQERVAIETDAERRDAEERREAPAPADDILSLQRTVGNAAVARAIAARQPAATMTPAEELEKAFFDDDWDRVVALAAPRATPSAVKRIAELDRDQLRYLDDAIRRADQEGSWLGKCVKSEFDAKKVPEKEQEPGQGYGKVKFKNTFIEDGDATTTPRKSARYGFEISFMPNYLTIGSAEEIGFIQNVRVVDLDTGVNRAANGANRLASDLWHVDRLDGKEHGWYGMTDAGGGGKTLKVWQKSDWDEPAWMRDIPSRTRGNIQFQAETAIVCRKGFHAGKVYATVHWGFEIDKNLVVSPYETEVFNKESEAFRDAVDAWNAQAAGPVGSRSSPNQHPLPTNFH